MKKQNGGSKMKTPPFPHPDIKITCAICGNKFNEMEMTSKRVDTCGLVICCDKCGRKEVKMSELRSKCCGAEVKYYSNAFIPLPTGETEGWVCLKCNQPTEVEEKEEERK